MEGMPEDESMHVPRDANRQDVESEIARFEKRVEKGTGEVRDHDSDDESGGLTEESREQLKSKMLLDQLYQK